MCGRAQGLTAKRMRGQGSNARGRGASVLAIRMHINSSGSSMHCPMLQGDAPGAAQRQLRQPPAYCHVLPTTDVTLGTPPRTTHLLEADGVVQRQLRLHPLGSHFIARLLKRHQQPARQGRAGQLDATACSAQLGKDTKPHRRKRGCCVACAPKASNSPEAGQKGRQGGNNRSPRGHPQQCETAQLQLTHPSAPQRACPAFHPGWT